MRFSLCVGIVAVVGSSFNSECYNKSEYRFFFLFSFVLLFSLAYLINVNHYKLNSKVFNC